MENQSREIVCEFNMAGSLEKINSLLEEGYEVTDIIPIHQTSGGGITTRIRGHYVLRVLFHLHRSEKKTKLDFALMSMKAGYLDNFNRLLESKNSDGFTTLKIIPHYVFLDPEARSGIGKGTYGFGVYFVKVLEK